MFVIAILFASAGRTDWYIAWVFLGTYFAIIVIGISYIDPDLTEVRSHIGPGAKKWGIFLASLAVVFLFPAILFVAGLDAGRYHWSPVFALWIQLLFLLGFVMGSAIQLWAMLTNKLYSDVMRIQIDRGHYVITGGSYKYVRHPGYTGAIIVSFSIPLLLGSFWALIPALIGDCFLLIRTIFEDNTLKNELKG